MLNITALLLWCVVSLFSELCIRGMYVLQNVKKTKTGTALYRQLFLYCFPLKSNVKHYIRLKIFNHYLFKMMIFLFKLLEIFRVLSIIQKV